MDQRLRTRIRAAWRTLRGRTPLAAIPDGWQIGWYYGRTVTLVRTTDGPELMVDGRGEGFTEALIDACKRAAAWEKEMAKGRA